MKNQLILFFFVLFSSNSFCQNYYETSWISNNIKYTGFVIFYNDNEALVRIKYNTNGDDKVAQYVCAYQEFTKNDGTKDRYLNGNGAKIMRGPTGYGYSADNFYFKSTGNGNYQAYTVDDNGLKGSDITQYMSPTLYWVQINREALTEGYLDDYFGKNELLYRILIFENKGEIEFPTNGNAITSLAHGRDSGANNRGLWSVVMSGFDSYRYNSQKIKKSQSYPSQWIKEQWDLGYHITTLEHDNVQDVFMVIMSKPSGLGSQSWKRLANFPKDWITEKWNNNLYITSMAYGNGEWQVIMNQSTGFTAQRWKTNYSDIPREWIKQSWNDGYKITSASYGNGLWAVVMTANSKLGTQSWKTQSEYPIDWIREKANNGYHITTITYGNGLWFVVMSNGTPYSKNMSTSSYDFLPINWILEKSGN